MGPSTAVRHFVRLGRGHDVGVFRMIEHDVIFHLRHVQKPKFAVRTGVDNGVLSHGLVVPRFSAAR